MGNSKGVFGASFFRRTDAAATPAQKAVLKRLRPEMVGARELGGEPIVATLTRAPGNNVEIGGLKVVAKNGWFAARPSGTEDIYKIYAESFLGEAHLRQIEVEALMIVNSAFVRRRPFQRGIGLFPQFSCFSFRIVFPTVCQRIGNSSR